MAKGKELVRYDAELAALAEEMANQEANTGGGQFFSIRGGTLKLNDAPIPNNEMAVVVVDAILENVFYEGDFDPDQPSSPVCYAFGRDEKTMAPHAEAEAKQFEACADCPNNQWGSAEKGRGKACRNRRRLALIPAGTLDARSGEFTAFEAGEFAGQQVAYLNLPPTSINGYGAYVKQLAATHRLPPQAVFTKVAVVPDAKTQVKVTFELLEVAPTDAVPELLEKAKEARAVIEFPYGKREEKSATPARGAKKAPAATARKPARRF